MYKTSFTRRGFRLLQALWAAQMGNYNLVILTEKKLLDAVYCKNRLRYNVVCSRATVTTGIGVQGGGTFHKVESIGMVH